MNMKKIISISLVLLMVTGLIGCIGKRETLDTSGGDKEIIYISCFAGGFGTAWMEEVIEEYNKTSEDYLFKRVTDNKYSVEDITDRVSTGVNDAQIYFADSSDIDELIAGNYLINLNDVWEHEENGKKLYDRVWDSELFQRAYSDKNDNLFAIPFTQGVCGVIYDHDLFTQLNLFLTDSSTANGLSKGIDGVEGTYDDGLPTTMKEFDAMIQKLNRATVIPFIYSDLYANDMLMPICDIVWGQYDGKTNYTNTLLFEGKYTSPSTGVETILTPSEGYKVYTENLAEGRDKAIEFLDKYLINTGYICKGIDGFNHEDTEGKYILSHNETPIAMLFDGFWWENEARDYFEIDTRNGEEFAYGKRDFRIMPIPAMDGHAAECEGKFYLPTNSNGSAFGIKTNDAKKDQAIKDFLLNFTKNATLATFSKHNSTILPYDYDMTEEQISKMTKFGQNFYEVIHSENVEIIRPDLIYSLSPLYSSIDSPERFNVTVNGTKYARFYGAIKDNGAEAVEKALSKVYTPTTWANMYNSVKDLYD